jgi:hypothetical protein
MASPMKHVVLLNGGLGNQLFQIAALFAGGTEHELGFESTLGFDKHASFMGESLSGIEFPKGLAEVRQKNLIWVKSHLANFLLKNDTIRASSHLQLPNYIIKLMLSLLIYLEDGVKYKIITESTMDHYVEFPDRNYFLIGYFQSSRWIHMEPAEDQFRNIDFKLSVEAQRYADALQSKKILGLHFRIGDYVVDSDMYGVLPNSYYLEALRRIILNPDKTVLFSDSILEASNRLLHDIKVRHEVAPPNFTATETLFLMTTCHSLVIANSSLSWWGAKIGFLKGATKEVVAPNPWFRLLATEKDLIDDNWRTVKPWNQ